MCRSTSSVVEADSDVEVARATNKGSDCSLKPSQPGPDGAESLRMAGALLLMSFLTSAGFRSAGFLYVGIMETYGVSRQEASWPLSLIGAVTNLAGVIAGPLAQRFPTRPVLLMGAISASLGMISSFMATNVLMLTISLGVFYGFGCGVIFTLINLTLAQYFDKYRAAAYGVVYAGSTMASFVFPNLLLALNSYYPFRGVLLLFGGIILNVFALSLYVREPSWMTASMTKTTTVKKASLRESFTIFKEPIFHVGLISNILFQYGFDAFMTTLVDFAVDRGATLQQAVNLLPWFSVADVIGRGIFPFAADRGFISRPKLITLCYTFTGIFTMCMPFSTNYAELVELILCMGSFCGCAGVTFYCVFGDCVGLSRLPLAFGILGTANGGFYFTKPFFFGHFRDVVKSYDGMFRITGAMSVAAGLLWLTVLIVQAQKGKKEREEEVVTADSLPNGCSNPSFKAEESEADIRQTDAV